MKKWMAGAIALLVLLAGGLLAAQYQALKYPVQPDGSDLPDHALHWLNRGYEAQVLDDLRLYDSVDLGDHRYVLMEIEDQLGMLYLEKGFRGNYRIAGSSYGGGNFHLEELEVDGANDVLFGGRNAYFGIASASFVVGDREYRVEIPAGDRFLTVVELEASPDGVQRHLDWTTLRFFNAQGEDITENVPWNGMGKWDGSVPVSGSRTVS